MAADLTTYAGRALRRPLGASSLTQQIYRLLYEHPEGMTRDELWEELREGWMNTDAYRAYDRARNRQRIDAGLRRRFQESSQTQIASPSATTFCSDGRRSMEYGSELFKERAQKWAIGQSLIVMKRSKTACRINSRWFIGTRSPNIQGQRRTLVPFDPVESREILTTTTTENIRREEVKAELLAVLKDKRIAGKSRRAIQLAYDHLCGRS